MFSLTTRNDTAWKTINGRKNKHITKQRMAASPASMVLSFFVNLKSLMRTAEDDTSSAMNRNLFVRSAKMEDMFATVTPRCIP